MTPLNPDGPYEKGLGLLTHSTFHVREGGEDKAADEYKTALFGLAEKALADGRTEDAIACARAPSSTPTT